MKLTIFQSSHGDCLLLTGKGGKNILIDGGLSDSYIKYVGPELGKMRDQGQKLDIVYISHIDKDHIEGVLQMLDDEVDWRVYEYHESSDYGNRDWEEPSYERPPEIGGIWHNAFYDQVGDNEGEIKEMLAASSGFLFAGDKKYKKLANHYMNLVTGVSDAIQVSNRIGPRQLDIPLNKEFDHKLALVRDDSTPIKLGKMNIYVIGPFEKNLERLRKKWDEWLRKHKGEVQKLRRKAIEDEESLTQEDRNILMDIGLKKDDKLGKRGSVSAANLASLMLLVEEDDKTILLAGDGHSNEILEGLEYYDKLNDLGGIHVNVLKVPHHGSEYNVKDKFAKLVTADHYVFCSDGDNANPDTRVVDLFVNSRIGDDELRSENPEVDKSFCFWFNTTSNSEDIKDKDDRDHMELLEHIMEEHKQNSGGKLDYTFFDDIKKVIEI